MGAGSAFFGGRVPLKKIKMKNLTAKEKAENIFNTFFKKKWYYYKGRKQVFVEMPKNVAKECALIAINNEYEAKIQAYNEMSSFCPVIAHQSIIFAEFERDEIIVEIEKL